ncbi:gpi anchored cell wall protein [Diplodia corticola]|uniref:Gpi anchored cell wall protein n=1 Tax=Diplodia corticola TaxID=236234 RepID=A0A1J9QUH7_9PEZI|nr:gpi anchored cell wall protein [Diplodia corticola]OJD32057.1 gpi anchored cell wall protein [Diplodia corticola]
MKYAFSPLVFTLGASAAALKRSDCCFQLTASGGQSGSVGQLNDGQNRVGGGYSPATYCLSNGAITDKNGRGCILTPPTTQFQCDEGASPTPGFAVGEGGQVTYNGSTKFYACPAADGEYNIYTKEVDGQDKCVEITLSTEGAKCAAASTPVPSAPPTPTTPPAVASTPEGVTSTLTSYTTECPTPQSSAPPVASSPPPAQGPTPSNTQPAPESPPPTTLTSTTSQTQTATSVQSVTSPGTPSTPTPSSSGPSSPGGCPADLAGDYQYPHLIVPVNASTPSQSFGTQYFGEVSSSPRVCSLFNFDIPSSYAGSACSAVFLLPHKAELETSNYTLSTPGSGSGQVTFAALEEPADEKTAWESVPEKERDLGVFDVEAGARFVVATGECRAGSTVAYEMCAAEGSAGLSFEWFQDWNPSPIGLFVRKC